MAFLAPIFSTILPAAGTVGGAVAGTGLLGTGLTVLNILQGAASAVGALGALSAGNAQGRASDTQAVQADLEAEREQNLGMQRRTAIKRELLQVLGENDVKIAAAGIDTGSGLAVDLAQSAEERAAQELSIDRNDQDYRAAQKRAQAAAYREQAASYRRAGRLNAVGTVLTTGLSMQNRG